MTNLNVRFCFFSKRDSWKPPTYQTKLTSFEKNCHILRRSLSRENTFLRFDLLGLFHLNLNVTTSFCSDNNMICIFFWTEDLVYIFFDSKTEENNSLKWNINMTSSLYSNMSNQRLYKWYLLLLRLAHIIKEKEQRLVGSQSVWFVRVERHVYPRIVVSVS